MLLLIFVAFHVWRGYPWWNIF